MDHNCNSLAAPSQHIIISPSAMQILCIPMHSGNTPHIKGGMMHGEPSVCAAQSADCKSKP